MRRTFGAFDLGQVAAVRNEIEGSLSEVGGCLSGLRDGKYPVLLAPDDESRHLEMGKLIYQDLQEGRIRIRRVGSACGIRGGAPPRLRPAGG